MTPRWWWWWWCPPPGRSTSIALCLQQHKHMITVSIDQITPTVSRQTVPAAAARVWCCRNVHVGEKERKTQVVHVDPIKDVEARASAADPRSVTPAQRLHTSRDRSDGGLQPHCYTLQSPNSPFVITILRAGGGSDGSDNESQLSKRMKNICRVNKSVMCYLCVVLPTT